MLSRSISKTKDQVASVLKVRPWSISWRNSHIAGSLHSVMNIPLSCQDDREHNGLCSSLPLISCFHKAVKCAGKCRKGTQDSSPWKVFFEPVGLRLPKVVEQLGEGHIVWQVVSLEELFSPNIHGWIEAAFTLPQALGAVVLGKHLAEETFVGVEP